MFNRFQLLYNGNSVSRLLSSLFYQSFIVNMKKPGQRSCTCSLYWPLLMGHVI